MIVEHYAEVYGRHNLLAASVHLDETSPHMHLLITPIDEQGRVRQASFIAGKAGMRANDRAVRDRLAAAGYDVDPEPRGLGRGHMTIDEYADWQQTVDGLIEREVEVEDHERRLDVRTQQLDVREQRLDDRTQRLTTKEAALVDEYAALRARAAEVDAKAADAESALQTAAQRLSEVLTLEASVSELMQELEDGTRVAVSPAAAQRLASKSKTPERRRATALLAQIQAEQDEQAERDLV